MTLRPSNARALLRTVQKIFIDDRRDTAVIEIEELAKIGGPDDEHILVSQIMHIRHHGFGIGLLPAGKISPVPPSVSTQTNQENNASPSVGGFIREARRRPEAQMPGAYGRVAIPDEDRRFPITEEPGDAEPQKPSPCRSRATRRPLRPGDRKKVHGITRTHTRPVNKKPKKHG